MDIIRTLGVFLVYKKKGLIKMEMNELQTLRHSASHILAQACLLYTSDAADEL